MLPGGVNILDFFRSLTFGGLLGSLIAGAIYLKFPYLHTLTSLHAAMIFGGLVGAGTQRGIQSLVRSIIYPIGRFLSYYEKLIELDLLLHWGKISKAEYETLNSKLTQTRFLGAPLGDSPQLPPKT